MFKTEGYLGIDSGNEMLLMQLLTFGPVSVVIDGSHSSFHHYKAGVYKEPKCNLNNLSRALLAVGYSVTKDTKEEYWLLKNSWGTDWGENGYIKLARNQSNMCGIASFAIAPLIVYK